MDRELRVIISGGGTGGHIFPAISIANAIRAKHPDARILFTGALGRMEMQRVPQAGYEIKGLPISGFDRKHLLKNIAVLFKIWKSERMARNIIKQFKPMVAVGVGGYASGPTLNVCAERGIPCLIQEQNSYAGVTNKLLAKKADKLWREVEFDWYTRGGQHVLYWHWSPSYGWQMNFPVTGYNECMVMYILAASSPTHSVPAECYHEGWARSGAIKSNAAPYDYPLEVSHNGAEATGGPLFWAHYSWFGLNPHGLKDRYANYWNVVCDHALSNWAYCIANPKGYKGYGKACWGLTASYSTVGYSAHAPNNDLGVITPTAALSSFPYAPRQSMAALKYFWQQGAWIWGKYGFYDAFSEQYNWTLPRYLAIDQLIITPMIENYRSGLLWKLFMSCPEIQEGLKNLGF